MKAAPEGVSMEIPRDAWRELERLCAQHEISAEIGFHLLWQIEYLLLYKHAIAPERPTSTQRAKQLEVVAACATELIKAIEALEFFDRSALDNKIFGVDEPGFEHRHQLARGPELVGLGGFEVSTIRDAALLLHDRLPNVGKAGAPSSVPFVADHIRCFAQVLMPAGILPTHAGSFKSFCDAAFACAGLKSPAKAIDYFMTNIRPEVKAAGRCL